MFRARRFFPLQGGQLCRTNNRGDFAKRVFIFCLASRFRNSENAGDFAEIGPSLNHIASIGRRSALRKKCKRANNRRHCVRVFRARCRFSSVRVVNYAEKITEATLQAWQPVELFLPLVVFSLPTRALPVELVFFTGIFYWYFPVELFSAAKITRAAPPSWCFMKIFGPRRVLPLCVLNSAGELTRMTPQKRRLLLLHCRPSVSCRLLGEFRWEQTQRRRFRRDAWLKFFANVPVVRPGGRFRRGYQEDDLAETATSLDYFAAIGLRSARMQMPPDT